MTNSEQSGDQSELIGVMIVGAQGAVATTLIAAGLIARLSHEAQLPQSLEGRARFELPSEAEPLFAELELPQLHQLRFSGWDICDQRLSEAAAQHDVLPASVLLPIASQLDELSLYSGVWLSGAPVHSALSPSLRRVSPEQPLRLITDALQRDIEEFRAREGLSEVILLDLSSTAKGATLSAAHSSLERFEEALDQPSSALSGQISEGMLYAYAALRSGCPCANFTPSTTFDIPALLELAEREGLPLCGKDGKTGQTLYKTALAPMFKLRGLRVRGWYSTNILGNRDGEVLDHPEHRQTKIDSKRAALSEILGYDELDHQVHIHYYGPRGDAKEAWDNIDLEGWFGVKMQMKVNWLGSDSVLAAPLAADLVRWLSYYHREGLSGPLPTLASYFKSPLGGAGHDLFVQAAELRADISSRLSRAASERRSPK